MENKDLIIQVAVSLREYNNLTIKCSCCKTTSYRSYLPLAQHIVDSLKKEKEVVNV